MRHEHIVFALVSLLACACGGTSSNGSTTQTTTTQSTTQTTTQTTGDAPPPAQTTSPAPTSSGDAENRAVIIPDLLENCTPAGAEIAHAQPVTAHIDDSLGGCGFRTVGTGTTENSFEFDVFGETRYIADRLTCTDGRAPTFDWQHMTYGTFSSTHRSSQGWEVVFAVDDGERVHVGVRLKRLCVVNGTPTDRFDAQGLEVAGANRAITLHRCTPERTQCMNAQ